jgi:hypothetical protein
VVWLVFGWRPYSPSTDVKISCSLCFCVVRLVWSFLALGHFFLKIKNGAISSSHMV